MGKAPGVGHFSGFISFCMIVGRKHMHGGGHENAGLVGMIKQWVLNCLGGCCCVCVVFVEYKLGGCNWFWGGRNNNTNVYVFRKKGQMPEQRLNLSRS